MMTVLFLCLVAAFSTTVVQSALYSDMWQPASALAGSEPVCFTIAVKHEAHKLEAFEKQFWELSDPDHANYGKYLTRDDITAQIGPDPAVVDKIVTWVKSAKPMLVKVTGNRDFVDTCMAAHAASKLFGTSFMHFSHSQTGETRVRASSNVRLPAEIDALIDFVGGADSPLHSYKRVSSRTRSTLDIKQRMQATTTSVSLAGGDQELSIFFKLIGCPVAPCTTQSVTSVTVNIQQNRRLPQSFQLQPGDYSCDTQTPPVCLASLTSLTNYVKTTATVEISYTNGTSPFKSNTSNWVFLQPYTTPAFLKTLYGVPNTLRSHNPQNSQAVAEFLNQSYTADDLRTWLDYMGIPQSTPVVIGPNSHNHSVPNMGEATLDIETIMGLAVGVPTTFWATPGNNHETHNPNEEPFLVWLKDMAAHDNPPLVNSVSFGDVEENLPKDYTDRLNVEFQKAGARGLSILIAAGDLGVASNGATPLPQRCMVSHPEFPTDSPYITSVGATQLSSNYNPICSQSDRVPFSCAFPQEKMCDAGTGGVITSGGGFSRRYARPSYQADVVDHYLTKTSILPKAPNFFNSMGRAYPDVTAYGTNFILVVDKSLQIESGTSASTPTFSAIVSLLNDVRLTTGQPSLGFLNPWLYKVSKAQPTAFNDITVGENKCTVNDDGCCPEGFQAAAGWDAVSGLGSPNYKILASIIVHGMDTPFPFIAPRASSASPSTSHGSSSDKQIAVVAIIVACVSLVTVCILGYRLSKNPSSDRERLLGSTNPTYTP